MNNDLWHFLDSRNRLRFELLDFWTDYCQREHKIKHSAYGTFSYVSKLTNKTCESLESSSLVRKLTNKTKISHQYVKILVTVNRPFWYSFIDLSNLVYSMFIICKFSIVWNSFTNKMFHSMVTVLHFSTPILCNI